LAEQSVVTGLPERKPMLQQLQRILSEDMPAMVMYYRDGEYAFRTGAYSGWISDLGHGALTKRSFLPEYAAKPESAATQSGGGTEGGGTGAAVAVAIGVGLVALIIGGAVIAKRRRAAEAVED
jgi:hypothetical protein